MVFGERGNASIFGDGLRWLLCVVDEGIQEIMAVSAGLVDARTSEAQLGRLAGLGGSGNVF